MPDIEVVSTVVPSKEAEASLLQWLMSLPVPAEREQEDRPKAA